ncbi:MAG: pyruvate dehydrogenase (acetyl-transferring) E1 component subunit alpha [Oligoflexales bacterium]|nr:pyruvate dehydrogenase (acetyl-transferring) E1 component subunit alpha [Oligoflexales bacterium]
MKSKSADSVIHKELNKELSKEFLISIYREMLLYRRFEERVNLSYTQQKFSGFCHLHIGQEALCVGVQRTLTPEDYMISGYRSHTQAIAKGIDPKRVFAELYGKVEGCSQGKGGSMHMFSKEARFLGGHGIVGGQAPIALGVGFAIRYRKESSIIVCYLGDAAMNQGAVFEAMNMAQTWKLPVLFVIENNHYGMGTAIQRTTSIDHLYKRAHAFDMPCSQVDGMDVKTVFLHVKPIVDAMRGKGGKTSGPYLLEALTYRYKGHSVSDPATYRSKDEVLAYQKRDPLLTLAEELKSKHGVLDKALEELDQGVRAEVKVAEQFADQSSYPEDEAAWMNVFA